MKTRAFLLTFVAATAAWCPPIFAQQIVNGAIPTPLSPTGVTGGVAMTGQGGGGTLVVGTIGGAQSDIFTNNASGGGVTNALLKAISTDASSLSNVVFNSSSNVYGAIGVTNPAGPFFLNINGANNGTVVNFNGSLFGTITTVSGTGTLNFNSGSNNISATNFAADGKISLAPNTTLIGAQTTSAANTGTLIMGAGSVLTGAVGGAAGLKAINVVGGSNAAGVSSSISGAVNAYSFNLGTNTLNIGGALTIANKTASGVINTTLASPTVYGSIRPTGATNLGSALLINVAVPSSAFIPVGSQFNIVQTQSGTVQSGTNGSIVTVVNDPTNPLYTFVAVPAAGTIAGQVTIQTTGIPLTIPLAPPAGVTPPPVVSVAAPVVPAVVSAAVVAAPTSDLAQNVLPAINSISNATTVINAVAQLAPSNSDLAAPIVTFQGSRAFQNLLSSHLREGLCNGGSEAGAQRRGEEQQPNGRRDRDESTSSCPQNNQYEGLWAKGFGYFGDQGAQGAFAGYASRILGGMVGYDTPLSDDTRVGLSAGYARSTITGKALGSSTGINTYQLTAYIAHEDGKWFGDGNVSYGWNGYSGTRRITFPGLDRKANAKYAGNDLTVFLTAGRHFDVDELTVTPLASLQNSFLNMRGYAETGAGDINLQVAEQHYTFLESGLGMSVAQHFDFGEGRDLLPEVHVKWLHEILDVNIQNTVALVAPGSTSFVTSGPNNSPDTLNLGTGITLLSCGCNTRTWSIEAMYDYYWKSGGYSANQVTLAASYRF